LEYISRRGFVQMLAVFAVSGLSDTCLQPSSAQENSPERKFDQALKEILGDPQITWQMRSYDELALGVQDRLEKAPITHAKSSTKISDRADELIVACEVSSEKVYKTFYSKPVRPPGASGVTIGIGYDVGQASVGDLVRDWAGYLAPEALKLLNPACGIKGQRADLILDTLKNKEDLIVSWETAYSEFSKEARPRYVGMTEEALENTVDLHPDSLGALVSLVYNRGTAGFFKPSKGAENPNYLEMRNIAGHMKMKHFDKIPQELRCMKRIWINQPKYRGLLLRRDAEANLFELGLNN
jgi:hypothetical protein